MSVVPSDIVVYGSARMTESDSVTIGGAVDFTRRVAFYDISVTGFLDVVSTATADTATKVIYNVRDSTGAVQTETLTLNGRTAVAGTKSAERMLYAALTGATANGPLTDPGGTAATGDVALGAHTCVLPVASVMTDATTRSSANVLGTNTSGTTPPLFRMVTGDAASVSAGMIIWTKAGTGAFQIRQIIATSGYGTDTVAVSRDWAVVPDATTTYKILQGMVFEILPNPVTAVIRMFSTSAADVPAGSQRIFYEKVFVVNNNTATALTGAQIEIASETPTLPTGALLDIALCTALNDANTSTNRQTAPASGAGAFVTQPAFAAVPGSGNLSPGTAPNTANAEGVWLRLTLPAGTAAYKGSADVRTQGTTT